MRHDILAHGISWPSDHAEYGARVEECKENPVLVSETRFLQANRFSWMIHEFTS
jgi:hypothetical protein